MIKPPEGYMLLKDGDPIQGTELCLEHGQLPWVPSSCSGGKWDARYLYPMCRRIEDPIEFKIKTLRGLSWRGLALGYLRYEQVRLMTAEEFKDVFHRAVSGENFDSIIDTMIRRRTR